MPHKEAPAFRQAMAHLVSAEPSDPALEGVVAVDVEGALEEAAGLDAVVYRGVGQVFTEHLLALAAAAATAIALDLPRPAPSYTLATPGRAW